MRSGGGAKEFRGWFAVRLIRELDVFSFFSRFYGVRLIHECVQIYGNSY